MPRVNARKRRVWKKQMKHSHVYYGSALHRAYRLAAVLSEGTDRPVSGRVELEWGDYRRLRYTIRVGAILVVVAAAALPA